MAAIALDLGGTKIEGALYGSDGSVAALTKVLLDGRTGFAVASLACQLITEIIAYARATDTPVDGIGICVPGIVRKTDGAVWAPNIPEWDYLPLRQFIADRFPGIHVAVDSDRSCAIYGSTWLGAAAGCHNAVFIAVGTGIGLGIKVDGHVIRGHGDIAGAAGWLALETPYHSKFDRCGCFEHYASGTGIGERAREIIAERAIDPTTFGGATSIDQITAHHVFSAYAAYHPVAIEVIDKAIEMWGMASANLISLFNPERVIWGGGIFGPATPLIPRIKAEAARWAQPIAINQAQFVPARQDYNPILCGAAYIALNHHA